MVSLVIDAMKKIALTFLIFSKLNHCSCQEIVAAGGDYLSSAIGSFSLTIGELVSETFSSNGFFLTQGFQQNILSNNQLEREEQNQLLMFPNPASKIVNLFSEQPLIGEIIILNLSGCIVFNKFIHIQTHSSIFINDLEQATYFVYFKEDTNKTTFLGNLIKIDL
jgi:hypothetical protein